MKVQKRKFRKFTLGAMIWICALLSGTAVTAQTASIGDFVWQDLNQNGIQESTEIGLANVQVELFSCTDLDNPVDMTFSDNNGAYLFDSLPAGMYRLRFNNITGFNPTFFQVGNDATLDSDVGMGNFTDCISLSAGETLTSIDAGFQSCDPNAPQVCNDAITVSLGPNGEAEINADILLEGDNYCNSQYEIDIEWNGISIGNTLTCNQVGDDALATITNLNTGSSCSVELTVLETLDPLIFGDTFITVPCYSSVNPSVIGGVTTFDNCGAVSTTFDDNIVNGDCSDPFVRQITRTWTATDQNGNTSTFVQVITQTRPDIEDIDFPPTVTLNGCGSANTNPSVTGRPTLNGNPVSNGDICGFQIFFNDVTGGGGCQGESTIVREWVVIADCSSEVRMQNQVINITDGDAPFITCPADLTIGTNSGNCSANIFVPMPTVSDNCSSNNNIDITFTADQGTVSGNFLLGLPIGETVVTFTATDDCGNSSTCDMSITVLDDDPPIAICDEQTTVSLGSDGTAEICWPTFNDGSTDNCEILAFAVKRADAPGFVSFTECVEFDCDDLGSTIEVRMRVYDAIGNFTENDPNGRFNECTVEVEVQDKLNPVLTCPPNKTVDCWEDFSGIDNVSDNPADGPPIFFEGDFIGYYAGAFDNCGIVQVDVTETGQLDNCGEGTFTRIFEAEDASGNKVNCTQTITVQNDQPFDITDQTCNNPNPFDGVIWPCDFETTTCGPQALDPSVTGEPEIIGDACDLVGVDFEDANFPIQEPGCIKIVRTWTILDWCQPDNNSPFGYKFWQYTQEIKVLNSLSPVIVSGCKDSTYCTFEPDCQPGPVELAIQAMDDCTPAADLNYLYRIDLDNDGVGPLGGYDLSSNSNGIAFPSNQPNEAGGYYPKGTHRIFWKVEDGCGNVVTCDYTFTVVDCKVPTPVVLGDIVVELNSQMGMAWLAAKSLDKASYDNCTDSDDLVFAFSPNPNDNMLTFDCDDVGTQFIDIYVFDEDGNFEVATQVEVLVQDNGNFCDTVEPVATVAGLIATEAEEPVTGVQTQVMQSGSMLDNLLTSAAGGFDFQLPTGQNFTIHPSKNDDVENGVSTFDLVLISQHILNVDPLNSPYKMIAADANKDGKITALDILELRKIILQLVDELPNNESWRFVDAAFQFPNPNDPFQTAFPEVIDLNSLSQDMMYNDFVGIKVGDINGDVQSSPFAPATILPKSAEVLSLEVKDEAFEAGAQLEVSVTAGSLKNVAGTQFALKFDKKALSFEGLESGLFGEECFGYRFLDEGMITVSYHDLSGLRSDEILFTLQFRASASGALSQRLSISSEQMKAEAYVQAGEGSWEGAPVVLHFEQANGEEKVQKEQTELFQNVPNPFQTWTDVPFYLAEAGQVELIISDASGKQVKRVEGWMESGRQQIRLQNNDLPAAGVYFCTLRAGSFQQTRKMVLLD